MKKVKKNKNVNKNTNTNKNKIHIVIHNERKSAKRKKSKKAGGKLPIKPYTSINPINISVPMQSVYNTPPQAPIPPFSEKPIAEKPIVVEKAPIKKETHPLVSGLETLSKDLTSGIYSGAKAVAKDSTSALYDGIKTVAKDSTSGLYEGTKKIVKDTAKGIFDTTGDIFSATGNILYSMIDDVDKSKEKPIPISTHYDTDNDEAFFDADGDLNTNNNNDNEKIDENYYYDNFIKNENNTFNNLNPLYEKFKPITNPLDTSSSMKIDEFYNMPSEEMETFNNSKYPKPSEVKKSQNYKIPIYEDNTRWSPITSNVINNDNSSQAKVNDLLTSIDSAINDIDNEKFFNDAMIAEPIQTAGEKVESFDLTLMPVNKSGLSKLKVGDLKKLVNEFYEGESMTKFAKITQNKENMIRFLESNKRAKEQMAFNKKLNQQVGEVIEVPHIVENEEGYIQMKKGSKKYDTSSPKPPMKFNT